MTTPFIKLLQSQCKKKRMYTTTRSNHIVLIITLILYYITIQSRVYALDIDELVDIEANNDTVSTDSNNSVVDILLPNDDMEALNDDETVLTTTTILVIDNDKNESNISNENMLVTMNDTSIPTFNSSSIESSIPTTAMIVSSTTEIPEITATTTMMPDESLADDDNDDEDVIDAEIHGVPSNPTGVTAVAYDARVEVSWKAPDDDGSDPIIEYEVGWYDEENNVLLGTQLVLQAPVSLRSISPDSPLNEPAEDEDEYSTLSITTTVVSHLANGRSYTFKVRAKNKNGYSTWSAKSLPVSPLHPADLCGHMQCAGHGVCFPNYEPLEPADSGIGVGGVCMCRPGYSPPDCSAKTNDDMYMWTVSEWSSCSAGCGGGQRTRTATCYNFREEKPAPSASFCSDLSKPHLTGICNGMECGSKLVSMKYTVEMSFDEVLFSPESQDAFELAFTTEVSAALQIPRSRLEVTAITRGSIIVFLHILPASRAGEKSLNGIVDILKSELSNSSSTLLTKGTFARRVEPARGVKVSFSIADQRVVGDEEISIVGLIGTIMILCFFVSMFSWYLRRRHERITGKKGGRVDEEHVKNSSVSDMKRMVMA